ncbi:FAD-dependent monooxygenase azaH [Lachnellula suecica]|uniref:FAD-dependent monooxygenase azaH n=1 Tax=Lachnellula suecica TaxID=602035 RepID=A0A8T9C401_9HELO|nr:FAD-dependent monooxygenase azaH [Lachnellula suecica]
MPDQKPLEVAIIGGGITGVTLALGLQRRAIPFTIYERTPSFREIGAGIGFTPNAERAMRELDPRIHQCFREIATRNKDDYLRLVDGLSSDMKERLICEIGVSRDVADLTFLLGIVEHLPKESVKFGKSIEAIEDVDGQQVQMTFEDGSTAQADVVIGCDGIHSKMRQLMFDTTHPACRPAYAHKFAFRGLISAEKTQLLEQIYKNERLMHMVRYTQALCFQSSGIPASNTYLEGTEHLLGAVLTCQQGTDAHVVTFPVAAGKLVNVVAFVTDPHPWPLTDGKLVMPATKEDAVSAYTNFGPAVRHIISLLPDVLDKWAIFDMYDNPLPTFVRGRLGLAGDAAHPSSPNHGAGAGCGIEDALALAEVLAAVQKKTSVVPIAAVIPEALEAYNEVRYERGQWLVESSRIVGTMYERQHEQTNDDEDEWRREFSLRCHTIWDFDVQAMVGWELEAFERKLSKGSVST